MNENVLEDRTIVVTRPESRALELTEKLEELGAKPLAVPSIRFSKMADSGPWDDALSHRDLFKPISKIHRVVEIPGIRRNTEILL